MTSQPNNIPVFALYGEEMDFPDLLHVETIGARAALHGWSISPHRHQKLQQFVVLLSGSGVVTMDGRPVRLTPPVAVNLPPRTVHSFQLEEGAMGDVITLPIPIWADILVTAPSVSPALARPFVTAVPSNFAEKLVRLRAELRHLGPHRGFRLKVAVGEVVLALLDAQQSHMAQTAEGQRTADPRLAAFLAAIDNPPTITFTVADAAQSLRISPRQLSRLCIDGTGQSAQALIHAAVLREACRLLAYTRLQVAEIGHRLGFEDPSYFSRFFQRHAGTPPKDYRARLNG